MICFTNDHSINLHASSDVSERAIDGDLILHEGVFLGKFNVATADWEDSDFDFLANCCELRRDHFQRVFGHVLKCERSFDEVSEFEHDALYIIVCIDGFDDTSVELAYSEGFIVEGWAALDYWREHR